MSEEEYDFFDELLSESSEEDSNFMEEAVDADEIINSLHLSVPELLQHQHQQPAQIRSAPKMTDLGLKMSKMILKQGAPSQSATSTLDLEEGDALVDNYGNRKVRQRPGKRGRPKGTVKDATTQFGRTSSTHALPSAVAALMGRANVAYVQQKYEDAVELYLQVVQRAPSSPEPYYSLGLVWEERGDADRAASYFLISAHLQGKADAELWRKIAALLVQCPERKEQAIYALTRAIKCVRRAGKELYLLRAKLHLELHQYRQVISSVGGLIRQQFSNVETDEEGDEFDVFGFLARIALHMSLAYLAAAVLEESLNWAVKRGFSLNYNHLNLLTELRAVDEDWLGVLMAIEAFLPTCHQSTGAEQGRTEWWLLSDAQKLKRALQTAPVELRFAYQLALFRLRRPEGTLEALMFAFNALIGDKPTALIRQLTDALMEAGEFTETLKIYLSPECAQMTTQMCLKMTEAYMKIGDFSSAEESVYAILHVDQDSRQARLLLADIFRATGRIEEALQILPDETTGGGEENHPEKEFINWQALDSLFDRSLGVRLEVNADAGSVETSLVEVESSDSSGTATPTSRRRLRFGPERIKRSKSAKIVRELRPMTTAQISTLRQKMKAVKLGDLKAAEAILTACVAADGTGLSGEEWSEAVGEAALLQVRQNNCDFGALLRVLKSILESLQLSNDARLRLMTLLAASRAEANGEVLFQMRWFISRNPSSPRTFQLLANLASRCDELRLLELSSNFFRFLARRQATHPTSFPLHLALGHQSLATHNYDEAARQYWQSAQLAPQNCSLSLYLGNALLWRSFQRTCVNQPAKLLESLAHFQKLAAGGTVRGKYNLARAFQISGFKAEAVRLYREIEHEFLPAKYNLSRL